MLSTRHAKSETCLSSLGHDSLASRTHFGTRDVSLDQSCEADFGKTCAPTSFRHGQLPLNCSGSSSCHPPVPSDDDSEGEFIKTLLSLPIMAPIIAVVKKCVTLGIVDDPEEDILRVIDEAMHDPSSPWSRLMPKSPPVTGPRTPEQYFCALDIAINARKESKARKKIAKYWKQVALQGCSSQEVVPLTPSPSDISDTGLSEPLSSSRRDRLQELITKRNVIALSFSSDLNDPDADLKELDDISASLRALEVASDDGDEPCSRSTVSSPIEMPPMLTESATGPARVDDLDVTLVDLKEEILPSLTKIPTLKRQHSLPVPPASLIRETATPKPSKLVLKTHTCCKAPQPVQQINPKFETSGLTSVQTKRRIYESLTSRPLASPVSTPTPASIGKSRSKLEGTGGRNLQPQKLSIKSPHPSLHSALECSADPKPAAKSQHKVLSGLNGIQRGIVQHKASNLPQARRQLKTSA